MIIDWKGYLRVLFNPSVWFQNYRYSAVWDSRLRRLLSEHRFRGIGKHTAFLGESEIWIANHPYASFTPYRNLPEVRPKRITILRAYDALLKEAFSEDYEVEELERMVDR